MLNELSRTSWSSTEADNRFLEFQSSTMTSNPSSKSQSLSIPVPLLIVFSFVSLTPVSDYPPSFSWLPFEGASKYILKLEGSKGIVWLKEVPATSETTVTYDGTTLLQPGEYYIFKVEIERKKSYLDYQFAQEEKIAQYVREGISKIKNKDLPNQFKASLIAQLDGLLIAREEILDIIQGVTRQGSHSEIICFLHDFMAQASAFELLAKACSSDNILDALAEIANQLAAANITLGEYLRLSGVQKSLAKSRFFNGGELAFSTQNLQRAFLLTDNQNSLSCEECEARINIYPEGHPWHVMWKHVTCLIPGCSGCPACLSPNR